MNLNLKKIAVGAMAVAATTVALPPSPAAATNSVNCSSSRPIKVHYEISGGVGTAKCFGGSAGPLQVNIGRVHRIETGQYRAQFFLHVNGRNQTTTLNPSMSINYGSKPTVYQIWIQ